MTPTEKPAATARTIGGFLSVSLDSLHAAFGIIGIIGAALTAASVVALFFTGAFRDRANERKIAELNASAAKAELEAVQLNVQLAATRVRLAQVQSAVAWRELGADQATKLRGALITNPQRMVVMSYNENDPEAEALASQIRTIVGASGCRAEIGIRTAGQGAGIGPMFAQMLPRIPPGLAAASHDPTQTQKALVSFHSAGLELVDLGKNPIRLGGCDVVVFVGPKPRP